MWRPKSDIARLQYQDVIFHFEQETLTGVSLISRMSKEAQQKTTSLGVSDNYDMCPVRTLHLFIQKTESYRGKLKEDRHTLCLAYLKEQQPTSSVSPSIVVNWVKNEMAEAGIDTTIYTPHSIRSASSAKAVQLGFSIKDVKDHANWSQQSQTFEKYYYKPNQKDKVSTTIENSMLNSVTDNKYHIWSPNEGNKYLLE